MQFVFYILLFLILIFIWIYKTPFPYSKISMDSIDIFFYTLLCKGKTDESILQNANLTVVEQINRNRIELIKYKEKGNTGIYLLINESNLLDEKELFLKKIRKLKLKLFKVSKGFVFSEDHYFVDINQNLELLKILLKFIWSELFKSDLVFELYLYNILTKYPPNSIEYMNMRNVCKTMDLNIPASKWNWIVYRISGRKLKFKSQK